MFKYKYYLPLIALSLFVLHGNSTTSAEERVARLLVSRTWIQDSEGNSRQEGALALSNYQENHNVAHPPPYTDKEFEPISFLVYTKEDVDKKNIQTAADIDGLQKKVQALNTDVENLSKINDALTKRLDELEKRMGDRK